MKSETRTSFSLADFTNRISVFMHSALSPNGKRLAYICNLTGEPQVWIGDLATESKKLLYPRPLTSGKKEIPIVIMPGLYWIDDHRLIVLLDEQGDEKSFMRLYDLKTGEQTDLARSQGRDFLSFIGKDKNTIFFASNRDTNSGLALYTFNLKERKAILQYKPEDAFSLEWINIFLNTEQVLVNKTISNTANELFVFNLKTKSLNSLFSEPNTMIIPITKLNAKEMLVISNKGRQFSSLARLSIKTKELKFIEKDQWDVDLFELSQDKRSLFVARNVAGISHLEMYQLSNLKKQVMRFPKKGVISNIHFSKANGAAKGESLIIGYQSPTEPKNYYRLAIKGQQLDKLTENWTSRVPASILVQPKSIFYESQGRNIQSWLFLPNGIKKNKTSPVLIWPHGGPQWQEKAQFRAILQYLTYRGFVVWCPNHTGSTGFGLDFTDAICGQWGTADLPDMKNGIEWLKASGWIDPKKITIMGGSYGGYMTLRSITKIPKTFSAAVDIFGVSNLLTFVKTVPSDWIPYMEKMVGHPEKDKEKLMEQSPINSLENIDCPLLVIQGAKDPRVVQSESDQVVDRLRKLGREVEYLVFEDEGHGFFRPENELKAYQTAVDFLLKHVDKN